MYIPHCVWERGNVCRDKRCSLIQSAQEGLKYELMKVSAVSGAGTYKELCIAAKNEEKRLTGLKKHEQYRREKTDTSSQVTPNQENPHVEIGRHKVVDLDAAICVTRKAMLQGLQDRKHETSSPTV